MLQPLLKQRTVPVFLTSLLVLLVSLLSVGSIDAQEPSLNCPPGTTPQPQIYHGIKHCTKDTTQILIIDPTVKGVRFETVLAQGYDKDGNFGECRDVNTPGRIAGENPGCRGRDSSDPPEQYPAEFVGEMAVRDPNAVAAVAFNADYFDNNHNLIPYEWGPQGLTVKNGKRFDGPCYGDYDGPEKQPRYLGRLGPSLAISKDGDVQIGMAGDEAPDRCKVENGKEVPYVINPDKYWNTVGGEPILVKDSIVYDSDGDEKPDYLAGPDPFRQRGRTVVGKTAGGRLIVVVEPDPPDPDNAPPFGQTLQNLAELMISFGAKDAINLDGGGSSQLWYSGGYLVSSSDSRKVPEALLIFSDPIEATLDQRVIPADGTPVESNIILESDVQYSIVVTGTYRYDVGEPGEFADAQYREADNNQWTIRWNSVEFDGNRLIADVFDSENNTYTFYVTGQDQKMKFRIYDNNYSDNEGGLTASIHRPLVENKVIHISHPWRYTFFTCDFGEGEVFLINEEGDRHHLFSTTSGRSASGWLLPGFYTLSFIYSKTEGKVPNIEYQYYNPVPIACAGGEITPAPPPESDPQVPDAIVISADGLNVRTGPGINYSRMGWVNELDELDVIGQDSNCSWLQVITPSGVEGWVSGLSQYVTLNLPCALVQPADIPPTSVGNVLYVSIPASAITVGSTPADIQQTLVECNETKGEEPPKPCQVTWFNEPRRAVFVKDFEIMKYEVTDAQYKECVAVGVCQEARRRISGDNDPPYNPVYFADDYPVVGVSWYDANTFCQWIGGRLPTEVEWEKAARWTDGRRYPWGNEGDATKLNSREAGLGRPTSVGQYSPDGDSPYGVADMAGNVFEWTDTQEGGNYVVRGGSWYKHYFRGRVTDRGTQLEPTFANYDVGFRCVRSAGPSPVPTPAPQIVFTTDRFEIDAGECVTLSWNVENVREVYLNNEGVVGRGLKQVCPTSTTTYHLRVVYQDGRQDDQQQTITVHGSLPPQISFTADPLEIDIGECTRLSWEVDNVREVYLGDDGVVGHSDKRVCPASTTTYRLRVLRQDGGQEDRQVTITVRDGLSYCQGDRSYDCTISATQEWQKTPLLLQSGDRFTISSIRGTWTVDRENFPFVGPDGYSSEIDRQICCHEKCKTDFSQPYAKLLARIGNGSHFIAGSGGTFTADRAGFLALRINDEVACQDNDAGSVTMRLERR